MANDELSASERATCSSADTLVSQWGSLSERMSLSIGDACSMDLAESSERKHELVLEQVIRLREEAWLAFWWDGG